MPRMWSSVDLPAPDGPMIETNSPSLMSALMRRRTNVRPTPCGYDFSTARREMSIEHLFGDGHRHALFDDATVEEVNAALGVACVARIVGDHADRRAGRMQFLQQIHHGFAAARG